VLVAGADRVDAGKTTFSTGLIERLDAVGYKPRAGNDYWFDHDDYRRAVADGRLYGTDAQRLTAAGTADLAPEEINPVHRLWRPSPGPGNGLLGQAHREFVFDRVGGAYVVNDGADVPASAVEALPLADARTGGNLLLRSTGRCSRSTCRPSSGWASESGGPTPRSSSPTGTSPVRSGG